MRWLKEGWCKVFSQKGFGEAKPPQIILSDGCGAAKPHHNHQKKERARDAVPRAPNVALALVVEAACISFSDYMLL
jgi:hypothetical protein